MLNASTVIEAIEQEHDFLLEKFAGLNDALARLPCKGNCERGQPCSADGLQNCREILDNFSAFLMGAMQHHFAHEERHMKAWLDDTETLEMFERHKEAHADLTEAVNAALFSESARVHRQSLSEIVSKWLSDHIATHDKALSDWMLSNARA